MTPLLYDRYYRFKKMFSDRCDHMKKKSGSERCDNDR